MPKNLSSPLRIAVAVLLISPSLLAARASAQVVGAAAASAGSAASASAAAGAAVRAPLSIGAMPLQAPSLSIGSLSAVPNAVPVLAPSALNAAPAASRAVSALEAAPAAGVPAAAAPAAAAIAAKAAAPSSALAVSGNAAAALNGVFRPDSKTAAAPSSAEIETRTSVLFDGAAKRAAADDASPVAASLVSLSAPSVLAKSAPVAPTAKAVPPAATAKRSGLSFAGKLLLVGAILLLTPGVALAAAPVGPVITAATALSYIAGIQPLAAAAGAVGGAIYGMFAARSKDGEPPSAGEVFSSILRYGVMGGAGAYILLDMSQIVFTGTTAIGLQPLTSAIAIAALGRTAFQDKFMDPATTSADRIMGAFPAVAAGVGISVGVAMGALAAPALAFTIATTAMAATGVATALFAALFKPGQSPLNGPGRMAKGYVLQALMMGLALAVKSNPYLFWPFALMGTAGFGLVLWTTALELWAHRPGAPAQPLPPAPPVKTPPATPAPAPTPAPKV